ncbi:uncharacterized protein LOC135208093 [Macrobrachium nipponense]|uniref:uncharacterized protein LOC135208093 n=1 Tax=Macrobrachium nipponense TaxID=159736 RepID=UPI0030C875CC
MCPAPPLRLICRVQRKESNTPTWSFTWGLLFIQGGIIPPLSKQEQHPLNPNVDSSGVSASGGEDLQQVWRSLSLLGTSSIQGLIHHLAADPVTHGVETRKTVSTPGYAAPSHLVYIQHMTTVIPSAVIQALLPYVPRRKMVPPPPGFAVLAPPPDFECPKSSTLDRPPVAITVPAASVPACGSAATPAGPSGQVELGRVATATAPAPSWMEDLSVVLRKLVKKKEMVDTAVEKWRTEDSDCLVHQAVTKTSGQSRSTAAKPWSLASASYAPKTSAPSRVAQAVANNSIHIVELLLDAGADPNRKDYHFGLPLHVAAEKGLLEIAQLLIKQDSEFNWTDDAGRTVLHALLFPPLVLDTLIPLINLFINRGCDVNARMTDGTTPLMLAVQCNAKEAVLRLLDCGADPNIIKVNGIMALHYAVEFCPDSEFTDESDMEAQQEHPSILVNILDLTSRDLIIPHSWKPIKYSIFHLAIEWYRSHLPLVINLGTEVDTPLGFLLSKPIDEKRAAVAKFMIDKGSNCNPATPSCLPPLVAAVKHQRASYDQNCPSLEVVEYLLKNGADILHKVKKSDALPASLHISSLFNVSAFFTLLQWGFPVHEVYTKEALEELSQTYSSSSDMEAQQEHPSILVNILDLTSRDLIHSAFLETIKISIFHLAIEWYRFNTLKLLIKKGIPPDAFLQETANAVLDEADVRLFLQIVFLLLFSRKSDALPASLHISSLFNVSAFFTLLQWGFPVHEVYTKEALEELSQTYSSSRYYAIYPLFPWRVISWLNVLNMFVPQLPLDTKEIFDIGRMVDDEHLTTAWNNLNNLIESPKDLQSLCVLAVRRAIGECRGWSNLSSHIAKLQFANAPLPQIIMERLQFKQIQKAHLFQYPPLNVMPNYCVPESLGDESGEEGLESEDENEEENLDSPQSYLSHSEPEDGLPVDEDVDNEEGNTDNPGADESIDNKEKEEDGSESHMSDDENLARLSCDSEGSGKDSFSNSGTKRKRP